MEETFLYKTIRRIIKQCCPPIFVDIFRWGMRKFYKVSRGEWEYVPGGWQTQIQNEKIRGWDVDGVACIQKKTWPRFIDSITAPRAFGFSNESVDVYEDAMTFHNNVMIYAYVLGRVKCLHSKIRLLDWGGSIGYYYKIAQSLYPDIDIEYVCKDMPGICRVGKDLIPEGQFFDTDDCLRKRYDLVMASTSLHYTKEWQSLLEKLILCSDEYVFINRLPVVQKVPSYVILQRPYKYGYDTEYIGWCLNQDEFLKTAANMNVSLERIFNNGEWAKISGAPEAAVYKGFLFRCKKNNV